MRDVPRKGSAIGTLLSIGSNGDFDSFSSDARLHIILLHR
ncbi:Uncharacterised protein [Vibrio cholerae]|nr:Uncharacterised protein [Vibrio cholerae]